MARRQRACSLEFKSEAVRRLSERRLAGVTISQVGRELGVRLDVLQRWEQYAGEESGRGGGGGSGSGESAAANIGAPLQRSECR